MTTECSPSERISGTAEVAALYREIDLRQLYVPDLPVCHRFLNRSTLSVR